MAPILGVSDERRQQIYSGGLDVSARAGFLLGAFYTGLSYQPNLLSRGTRDQAIVSGVAASVGYAWGVSAHSFLRSTADRIPASRTSRQGRIASGIVVDAVAAVGGLAVTRAVPPREHESSRRALIRLAGVGICAAGTAGLGADGLESARGRPGFRALSVLTAAATVAGGYVVTRPRVATRGSLGPGQEVAHENVVREVSVPKALASSLAVTAGLMAAARGESWISGAAARAAAQGARRGARRPPCPRPPGRHRGPRRPRLGSRHGREPGPDQGRGRGRGGARRPRPTSPRSPAARIAHPVAGPDPGVATLADHGAAPGHDRRGHGRAGQAADPRLRLAGVRDHAAGARRPAACARSTARARSTDRCSRCSPRPAPATSTTWRTRRSST